MRKQRSAGNKGRLLGQKPPLAVDDALEISEQTEIYAAFGQKRPYEQRIGNP